MPTNNPTGDKLARQLARLWPNREHESNALASLCCRVGIHRWRQLDLTNLAPTHQIRFCFWCSALKINNQIHHP